MGTLFIILVASVVSDCSPAHLSPVDNWLRRNSETTTEGLIGLPESSSFHSCQELF